MNEQLVFEGEYLNGKRYGKGIEYNNNGQIKYEGDYVNGRILSKQIEIKDGKIFLF